MRINDKHKSRYYDVITNYIKSHYDSKSEVNNQYILYFYEFLFFPRILRMNSDNLVIYSVCISNYYTLHVIMHSSGTKC